MTPWEITQAGPGVGRLGWDTEDPWWLDPQAGTALGEVLEAALSAGLHRVEAVVPTTDTALRRTLQRAGMAPEGTARSALPGPGGPVDGTRLARVAGDAPPQSREGFNAMLNATLPVKRVIAQGLIGDGAGRFLLCELTYKQEWDLPGGVVDHGESPARAAVREVREELGAEVALEGLLAVDWLPAYRRWDDAVLCVFDLGTHPDLLDRARLQPTEIRAAHWCDLDDARRHAAPYVVRLLERLVPGGPTAYLEDGMPVPGHGS